MKIFFNISKIIAITLVLSLALLSCNKSKKSDASGSAEETESVQLLHVSFDIAREIGKRLNAGFIPWYKEKTGITVEVEQSNGGSSRQARAVSDGLQADVVSMNQYLDIDLMYEKTSTLPEGAIIPKDWQTKYPNNSSPAGSTMAFVVRKGNPKNIKDWSDLVKPGIEIVAPNFRSTGNGRYSLLTAYAYGLSQSSDNNPDDGYNFVHSMVKNTVVLATGGRDATNVFVEREVGDVLLTFEAEVNLIVKDLGPDKFEVVVPSYGVDAKIYVVVVDQYAQKKSDANYEAAKAYWDFIYTPEGQDIVAQSFFRPIDAEVAKRYRDVLPEVDLFTIEDVYGNWADAKTLLFSDDGVVSRVYRDLGKQ